jgi:peptidoglycan/LPS O-acetylase OafA/YrhL
MNASQENSNLDFLRSCAVLFVVAFHVLLLFEHRHSPYVRRLGFFHAIGRWGVLIFFVHTSLVLMFSLERLHLNFPGKPYYVPFLTRRVFRIFPLSMFVVLVVTLLEIPVAYLSGGTFVAAHLHWPDIVSNLLLWQNLTRTDSVIVPLWSLPYEMQMYLLLPLLFLLARFTRYVWPILLLWVATAFLGSHSVWLDRHGIPDFVIFVPCFVSGIVAYKLTKTRSLCLPTYLWPLTPAAITVFYLKGPSDHRAWYSCLILGIAIPQFQEMKSPIICKTFQIVARYSYGIYLTHFICIWLAFEAVGSISGWLRWVILLITVSVFPYLLYHWVEKPMIARGEKVATALRGWLESPVFWGHTVGRGID